MAIDVMLHNQRGPVDRTNPLPSTGGFVYDSIFQFFFHPESLAKVYTYSGPNGGTDTITVGPDPMNAGNYYKKTYGYTGSNVTSESAWVKQ